MFSSLKMYLTAFAGAVMLGVLAYLKYLRASNEEQKENIYRLKNEIKIKKEVSKDEVKKAIFDTMQKVRAEKLKESEITLDDLEKEIKKHEDNNFDTSSFTPSRV